MTCGEYLRQRELMVKAILELEILNNTDKIGFKHAMERLYRWHYNRLFGPKASGDRKNIPGFWRDTILRAFTARQLRWTRKYRLQINEDGTIENLPLKASWRWGPHREGPEFNGLFSTPTSYYICGRP
ncbi:hypothetical protein AG0111_0g7233 [Alternaria gaisen]|uniref:Uncharacterized protein n=1 Tax=Alternaria gaisen TaxID=167740 RepID=A0ACB6FI83_9PLEO|nr:hypothetical protein AG0111_0g7233 [Alternaria gaisen]